MSGEMAPVTAMGNVSVADVEHQVRLIQDLMRRVMKEGVHFGKIPGCGDKPTLLKAGAEKIGMVFQLVPTFEYQAREMAEGHREYEFTCTLTHRPSGKVVGQGVGTCSTMESKYRYRWDNTFEEVPKDFWKTRDPQLIGGPSYAARKAWVQGDGGERAQKWFVFQKVEHVDPADYYNTVKKIAKKRALVDCTITATACSDIFDQDTVDEDGEPLVMPDTDAADAAPKPPSERPQRKSGKATAAAGARATNGTTWRGTVARCGVKKQGQKDDGTPWTIWSVEGKDGRKFDTFSDTHADVAASCAKTGEEVVITYERGKYGDKIKGIEVAGLSGAEEPGANG